jgi:hypothetical protein
VKVLRRAQGAVGLTFTSTDCVWSSARGDTKPTLVVAMRCAPSLLRI